MNSERCVKLCCVVAVVVAALTLGLSIEEWCEAADDLAQARTALESVSPGRVREASGKEGAGGQLVDSRSLLRLTSAIAARRSVQILMFKDEPALVHGRLTEFPAEFMAEGSFASLIALLDDLEGSSITVRIRRADFERNKDQNGVSLRARAAIFQCVSREGGRKAVVVSKE